MAKLMTTLTISAIISIMIIGGLIVSPDAYSTNDQNESDECSCEKPDTLKVKFMAPVDSQGDTFKIDIFKKFEDRDDSKKLPLMTIDNVMHGDGDLTISAIMFAKDKLESNTAFVVYKVSTDPNGSDELVALMEIHTSCSKPLFIGLTVNDSESTNNGYSLEVIDGLKETERSIPEFEPLTCEDKKPKKMGSITIRKAITNDNGGTAAPVDFTITVTNVETTISYELVHDQIDPLVNVNDVPAGTYKITETGPINYTTVLIAGDTNCPSMLDEVFTIKKGKNLSCTIYNDDNGDGSGGIGGPGVIIFQNNSLQVQLDANILNDSCDQYTIEEKNITPCIEIINKNSGDIAIVDSALMSSTTIILFSIAQEEQLDSDTGALNPNCKQFTIIRHDKQTFALEDNDLSFPTLPTEHLVVVLQCANMDTNKVYNVNYVMIDPTI